MKIKHTTDLVCPSCTIKLLNACEPLVSWFGFVKDLFPRAHISWSFRDEETQNAMVESGLSEQPWPTSKHNKRDAQGLPASEALDLFELGDDGKAYFSVDFYFDIHQATDKQSVPIRWGGTFEHLKDYNHFEISEEA